MAIGSRLVKQLIVTAALCAGLLAGSAMSSQAADLGLTPHYRSKHVWSSRTFLNWRDRCAYAGYYCLYAEYGYVFAYPFDDRPIAYASYRHRHRHR